MSTELVVHAVLSDRAQHVFRPLSEYAALLSLGFIVYTFVFLFQGIVSILPTLPLGWAALYSLGSKNRALRYLGSVSAISAASLATALLYDYLVPDYRFMLDESPDWEHGLTVGRLTKALVIQSGNFVIALCLLLILKRGRAEGRFRAKPELRSIER